MSVPVVVWDCPDDPPDTMQRVLCWQSYAHGGNLASVPRYLEEHAERLRTKYLAFIYDLGEKQIEGKRVVEYLDRGDGFSLWWTTLLAEKSPFKSPRIYDCLRLMALEELLNISNKPRNLLLHSADRELAEAMRKMCYQHRIPFAWRKHKRRKPFLRSLYKLMPYSFQGLLVLLRQLIQRWPLRRLQKPRWFSGENAIFLCSYFIHLEEESCGRGIYASKLWESLPKFLHDLGYRSNWIEHYLPNSAVPDTKAGLGLLRRFNRDADNQGYHAFLDTYLTWGVVGRVLKSWSQLGMRARHLKHIAPTFYPDRSAAWLWPLLRDDWMRSLYGPVAMCNCLWMELFDAALKDIPYQKLGLYICENQGWERAFLHMWRNNGHGEIIGVQHATVPFWHLYYFDDPRSLASRGACSMPLPDHLGVNGMAARIAFEEAGYPVERLVDLEALRYLNLAGADVAHCNAPTGRTQARSSSPRSFDIRVLVLGDMLPASTLNLLSLLEKAMPLFSLPCHLTYKPHPGYQANAADYPGLRLKVVTGALDQILCEYDIALSANSTSAAVDAYMAGLPVIIDLDGTRLNLNPLRGQRDVCFVSSPKELAEALREACRHVISHRRGDELFFLDSELPRWKRWLEVGQKMG